MIFESQYFFLTFKALFEILVNLVYRQKGNKANFNEKEAKAATQFFLFV